MRISDYIEQSVSNLRKKKLRTFLTTFGVVIGIGALVSMFAFGKGMQKNLTNTFNELELFNYVGVYARSGSHRGVDDPDNPVDPDDPAPETKQETGKPTPVLDDDFLLSLAKIEGVEWALPEIRFPALIRLEDEEEFSLIQVLPADICQAGFVKLRAGEFYTSDRSSRRPARSKSGSGVFSKDSVGIRNSCPATSSASSRSKDSSGPSATTSQA